MDAETTAVSRPQAATGRKAPRLEGADEPQRKGGRGWIWLVLIVLLAGGGYFAYPHIYPRVAPYMAKLTPYLAKLTARSAKPTRPAGARVVPVVVATARMGDMPIYLDGLGSVTAFNTVTLRTRVDGQIVKIGFVEGQMVREGDELFQIDPRPFQVQLEQAEGQMARDQAQLKNAKADLERNQIAREAVSQQQYDSAVAAMAQYEGAVTSDQAQIDNAKLQLTYCHITAPISGRIGLRLVDAGNIVHASDQTGLAIITQVQPIAVVFNIPQASIPQIIRKLDSAEGSGSGVQGSANSPSAGPRTADPLIVEVYDTDLKTRLATSTRLAIDSQVDQSNGTIRLKAAFPNQDNALFPNQFVNVKLLVDTRKGVVIVPMAAVQSGPDGSSFVWVVNADNTVDLRTVIAGPSEGSEIAIERGLAAGEQVVTEGVDKLVQGTKVAVNGAAGNRGPGSGSRVPASTLSSRDPKPRTRNPNNEK
jgi:multidrug efflux system membrane fusion protein